MTPRNSGHLSVSSSDVDTDGPPDAPTLVFVHGAGISRQMWRPQFESLSDEFRVVAFDLPGHGTRSDTSFEFETAVSSLANIVTDLTAPVVLIGHSLGGYVVIEYAARDADSVVGIVCSGCSADYRGWLGIRTRIVASLYRFGERLPFVERWFLSRTATQIRTLPISETTADAIIDGGFFLHSWGQAGSSLVGRNFRERLEQFEGPVLLVNGEADTLNVPNARRLARDLPNVQEVVIDDVGHLCNLQAPSVYTTTVRRFATELFAERERNQTS